MWFELKRTAASPHSCRTKETRVSNKKAVVMVQDDGDSLADGGDDGVTARDIYGVRDRVYVWRKAWKGNTHSAATSTKRRWATG